MANLAGLNDRMKAALAEFQAAFPKIPIVSGHRDTTRNAAVGGAKGSQHIHGNALDLSFKGMPEADQLAALRWWKDRGAGGFGYYPNSTSAHVDFGAPRAWGPNFRSTSLGQTPEFFRTFVGAPGTVDGARTIPAAAAGPVAPPVMPEGTTLNATAATPPVDPAAAKPDLTTLKGWGQALNDPKLGAALGGISKALGGGGGGEDRAQAAANTIDPSSAGAGVDAQLASLRTASAPLLMQVLNSRDRNRRPGLNLGMGV